nr:hypothetical protein [Sicyoidochytrium minutum DNA virus]
MERGSDITTENWEGKESEEETQEEEEVTPFEEQRIQSPLENLLDRMRLAPPVVPSSLFQDYNVVDSTPVRSQEVDSQGMYSILPQTDTTEDEEEAADNPEAEFRVSLYHAFLDLLPRSMEVDPLETLTIMKDVIVSYNRD